MIELLGALMLAGTGAGLWTAYARTRDFVRGRLRFVDAAQRPSAPWIAGVGVFLVSLPIFGGLLAFLPAVGGATALLLGASVGAGVRAGQKQVKLITRG